MPTSRRAPTEHPAVITAFGADGTATGGDEVAPDVAARDSALAALLVTPTSEIPVDPAPPRVAKPPRTTNTVTWDPDGVRYLVWTPIYRREVDAPQVPGETRHVLSARRGDVVVVPDNELTASHVRLGHLVSE